MYFKIFFKGDLVLCKIFITANLLSSPSYSCSYILTSKELMNYGVKEITMYYLLHSLTIFRIMLDL